MIQFLGVFSRVYPDGEMTITRALIISVIGFLIVFFILGIIAVFVKIMGRSFDALNAKKGVSAVKAPAGAPASPAAPVQAPAAAKGTPLPANTSTGDVMLYDVTEEEAAVVMAVVSSRSGIPLNRLKFNSIGLKEEK